MDKRDIEAQAEKYKREMMKLYGKSTSVPESIPEAVPAVNTRPEIEQQLPEAPDEPDRDIQTEPESEDTVENEELLDERYPEPDLSELETDFGQESETEKEPKKYISEENMGTEKGYILVNVRTGDDAEPVVNASVEISAIMDGSRILIAYGITDESGATQRFEVPVPDISYSQAPDPAVRPYNLFDISVKARGFFNSRSVDVPVFEGITSVQRFSMIPVPLFMKANDETVTYFNQEPSL